MKQLKTYSEKSLRAQFKPSEICFIIATKASYIDDNSMVIDDLKEAKEEVAEGEHIFICTRKKIIDCLDTDFLYQRLFDDFEDEGVAEDYLESLLGQKGEEEFKNIVTSFIKKHVGNAWVVDEVIGVLED